MITSTVDLPSGIVTFVFTDIEGSTRLVGRLGDGYIGVLERHRQILREAWIRYGGHEISAEGDGFFVAFACAADAVAACADGQQRLAAEPWPEGAEVRVRMGVHTGLATPYGNGYVALAVHQTSRVMSAGHGGQILVSEEAAAAVGDAEGPALQSLGKYRVRDFDEPQEIFGVAAEGLSEEQRSIRAVPAEGHNLVRPLTSTVGREALVSRLAKGLVPGRVVTLVGPGGVGKSRVAIDLGLTVAPEWEDGVWRVDLAAVRQPDLVAPAAAAEVGVPTGSDRLSDLLEHLADRRAVILLDNCEQLIDACRDFVTSLLESCAGVAVLATSRSPIHASGEIVQPVPPLPIPKDTTSVEEVGGSPAVRLFVDRGMAVRPGFSLDEHNVTTVAAICRHLDGLPLSLELAAANLAVQSSSEILAGLENRFLLLRSRDQKSGDRHQTMEGVLEWSYRLLNKAEQAAFRRVAVFGAGFTLDMATSAVALGDVPAQDVPQLVWSLADRSLVVAELAADATRYRMLETVQTYGRERLDETDETRRVASAAALHMLEGLGPWHPADRSWRSSVGVEIGNLRVLIPPLMGEHQEIAQQMAYTIGRYHDVTSAFRDGIEELNRFCNTLTEPGATRASMLAMLADLYLRTGDTEAAGRLVEEADSLRVTHGLPSWDDVGVDRTRGEIARRSGKLQEAIDIARQALERDLSARGRSRMYNLWGTTAAAMGDLETAQLALSKELELNIEVGYEGYIASARGNLAEVAMRLGEMPVAAHHQRACLELATAQGSLPMVAFSLIVAARVAGAEAWWETAVRLHAKAESMLSEVGLVLYEDDRRESDQLMADALDALGEDEFDESSGQGSALETPEAIGVADEVLAAAERRGSVNR